VIGEIVGHRCIHTLIESIRNVAAAAFFSWAASLKGTFCSLCVPLFILITKISVATSPRELTVGLTIRLLLPARNGERKRRAMIVVALRPESALMPLDDRATDGQADTHATRCLRVARIEEPVGVARIQAHTGISN
jgi:hypothetical protein